MPGKGSQGVQSGKKERVNPQPPGRADDRGTIPPLPEPEVEGVGNEGRGNNLEQNPTQRRPKGRS